MPSKVDTEEPKNSIFNANSSKMMKEALTLKCGLRTFSEAITDYKV